MSEKENNYPDSHDEIMQLYENYEEASRQLFRDYKRSLHRLCFQTIRDRLVELDGRVEDDIEVYDRYSDENEYNDNSMPQKMCMYECPLAFHLPYTNSADDDGETCTKRFYNFIATGVDSGSACLYLMRCGNSAKENENIFIIEVHPDNYFWLYKRLVRMGFFNDIYKTDFKMFD